MTIRPLLLAATVGVTAIGSATADERIDFTPPLYREQARPTFPFLLVCRPSRPHSGFGARAAGPQQ